MIEIILGIIVLSVFVWIFWRFSSRRFQLPCPTWLGWLVEMDNPFCKISRADTIAQHLELKPGMNVLDAGCGPGRLTIPVARKVEPSGEVVAMDIQAGMLQKTEEKARSANLKNIKFLHAALGEKKLEKGKFDRALLVSVLGEIPNQIDALKEIFDALKPGGILSVTEVIFDPHFLRRAAVLRLAQKAGFQENNFFGKRFAYTLNLRKPV